MKLLSKNLIGFIERLPDVWHEIMFSYDNIRTLLCINKFIEARLLDGATIYPFNPTKALHRISSISDIKIIILGQDPYHGNGQANGFAFSVLENCQKLPPSLRNICKELSIEYPSREFVKLSNLDCWANQGVLLLNSILTVEEGQPLSHKKIGWEIITDSIIKLISDDDSPKVFMLWGNYAQSKDVLISSTKNNHLILKANHPSPLSACKKPLPFIGCNHFKIANEWLINHRKKPIIW
ncbi:uracil-DNA glycosylase [Candidatus Kinetoplastibacterium oncopeltii TCC290E]|uniref:Uracil-DNA glycosylase n=1 Tax=Candidatus Kinetoplastidibacterium stringomonadis TCC290E TaxID=1208920 RepID=M1M9L8_9PROT|nr:uracil-DNA glycosylase [Candidatus Kinetoplastibacterium oncopeltii]AGF48645.1 uracil-DNA glycosylase [Candidatus Kinetoplastibacterium oncopeltii TCC290E]